MYRIVHSIFAVLLLLYIQTVSANYNITEAGSLNNNIRDENGVIRDNVEYYSIERSFPLRSSIDNGLILFLPRQKNSWVVFGTGNAPSA